MDTTVILVITLLVLAVAVVFLIVFRRAGANQRGETKIEGPLGVKFEAKASSDEPAISPGIRVKDAASRHGGLLAEDKTGSGIDAESVDVHSDIILSNTDEEKNRPK